MAVKCEDDPEAQERHRYDMAFHGHGRGMVITQVDGQFIERTMTPGELMARAPAMKIAQQIHKLACYAAFAYIECWQIIAPILSSMTHERDKAVADLCRWRSAFQTVTPGGSEFMSPESVIEYMQNLKRETVEANLELARLRKSQ